MRKSFHLTIYNNTSRSSSTAGATTPFTSTTRDPQVPRQAPPPGQEQRRPAYRSHPMYDPTAFVPQWVFDIMDVSYTSDIQWPYSPESDDDSKHELTLSQDWIPPPLPPLSSANGHVGLRHEESKTLLPAAAAFPEPTTPAPRTESPTAATQWEARRCLSKSQNRDGENNNQGQRNNNNYNDAIGVPLNNNFDSNSNSKQFGSVDQPCDHDPTQSQQQQKRQAPLMQLINGVHPDRLAMILEEQRARAALPPLSVPTKWPTQQTRSAPRHLSPKKKTLALASQPPCQTTPTLLRKPQKNTPPAAATKKVSKSTPSTPATAAKEAALAFELLLEMAMVPGNSGRGSRSILREQRKRLLAAGVEVPWQVTSILEDDTLSTSSDMDVSNDEQDDSASAPVDLAPFSVRTDDSVDESSTSGMATLSTLVQDSKLDYTGGPARFSIKQERYQPCTGVRVSCPGSGGKRRSVGENGAWAKSSFDQLRSALPSCMGSSSLPLPLLPPLEGYEASTTNITTLATLAREEVGSDITADASPLRARDEVLRRRKAATDRIIEYTKGSHGRAGNRD